MSRAPAIPAADAISSEGAPAVISIDPAGQEASPAGVVPAEARCPTDSPHADPSPGTTAPPACTCASDRQALEALRPRWLELIARHGVRSPNVHPARFEAILEARGESVHPFVIMQESTDGPRAAIIGRIEQRSIRQHFGYRRLPLPRLRCLDVLHGGLLGDCSGAATTTAMQALLAPLRAGEVDVVSLHRAPADHPLLARLADPGANPVRLVQGTTAPHWEFELVPGSFDRTLRTRLPRKRRHEILREGRVLSRHFQGDLELLERRRTADIDEVLTLAEALGAGTYKQALGVAVRRSSQWRALFASSAGQGWLRAWFLVAAGRPIAFLIGTCIGDRCFLEATGFRPELGRFSPGKHLLLRSIERLCEEGVRFVDYGAGDAIYKHVFGTSSRPETTLHVYGGTARARMAWHLHRSGKVVVTLGRTLAARAGALDRLRRAWRHRLEREAREATR